MVNINIEMIDLVLSKVKGSTYEDVRDALIRSDGDVDMAVGILESAQSKVDDFENLSSKKSIKKDEIFEKIGIDEGDIKNIVMDINKNGDKIKGILLDFFSNVTNIRLIIESEKNVLLNIPIGIGAGVLVLLPVATIIGFSGALLTNCTVRIEDERSNKSIEFKGISMKNIQDLIEIITSAIDDIVKNRKNNEDNIVETDYVIKSKSNYDKDVNRDGLDITKDLLKEDK